MTARTIRGHGKTITIILPCISVASTLCPVDRFRVGPVDEAMVKSRYVDEFWMTNDQLIKFPASGEDSFATDLR